MDSMVYSVRQISNLLDRQWFVSGDNHDVPPRLVDRLEHLRRRRQLSDDVWGAEDRFEIHPCALARLPLVQGFLRESWACVR